MSEQDGVKWYQSGTVIGGYVATACGVAQLFGIAVSPEDQATIAAGLIGLITFGSGLYTVYRRYNPNIKPIK